nr:amidohydrolase family protein [Actinomycetota bacterium]
MSPVLHGGLVADPARGVVIQADLGVSGDRIGGVPPGDGEVDVSGCVVLPGNVCAHHHLYSTLARGMPGPSRAPRNFAEILELVWWRLDRALDPDSIRLSALVGALEAARAGTTSIIDHHASPSVIDGSLDLVADAVEEAGLRAAVCYEVTDRHGEEGGRAGVAENARFLRANRRPMVRGMAGAHASFTLGPATLDALVAEARDLGAPLHIHVAEDGLDQE